ncbi:terpene synthase 10-like [Castanea sativa]|uniref:terpene synthase 10-like n=1 Tax=Castanea sativa TaxID=21020 RepID=UPI003F649F2C
MSLFLHSSVPLLSFTKLPATARSCFSHKTNGSESRSPRTIQCMAAKRNSENSNIIRRTANYQRPIWDYDYMQSLKSEYVGEPYSRRVNKLKEEVRMMLDKMVDPVNKLELIDLLQKLGLSYHFENDIKKLLKSIYDNISNNDAWDKEALYAVALKFQLLRQHGYNVSQEVFGSFMDELGEFKAYLYEDTKGMLYLYEASYLSIEGENVLEHARDFTTKHLEEFVKRNKDQYLSRVVSHALELPLDWRMPRLEARWWFIDIYERSDDMNPTLLELAKLDFNMVQATYQDDLRHILMWWRSTGLGEKLNFARDRLIECFLWTVGTRFEPQFGYFRRMSTRINVLITNIDDIYDVYGKLDELELFTETVERWDDINLTEKLPDYMKQYFYVLNNTLNEIALDTLKEQGLHIHSYLKKAWADLCKSYIVEARWYYSGYTPTLQEYNNNAWISIAGPVALVHYYFLVTNPITKEALQCLEEYHNIIRLSSMIFRFENDLGTSPDELKKGDVPKSIQCYMHETGALYEGAYEYIQYLSGITWKQMNKVRVAKSPFSKTYIGIAVNLSRTAMFFYHHGDKFGVTNRETKDRVLSLLVQPFPL